MRDRLFGRKSEQTVDPETPQRVLFNEAESVVAQIYSLVDIAKANGQAPYTWLRHVLERLPQALSLEDFEALLPWNCSLEMSR